MTHSILRAGALVSALLTLCGLASAQTFFGEDEGLGIDTPLPATPNSDAARAAFELALDNISVEDFEDLSTGQDAPLPLDFGAATASGILTGFGRIGRESPGNSDEYGGYPLSGEKYWLTCDGFTVTFDAPKCAFGFGATDIGDQGGQVSLRFHRASGGSFEIDVPHEISGEEGNAIFFGFACTDLSDAFDSVEFRFPLVDFTAFDDFVCGQPRQPVGDPYCDNMVNSTGQPGLISARGSLLATDNDLTLIASQMPPGQSGYFLVSGSNDQRTIPGSSGLFCLLGGDSCLLGRYSNQVFLADALGNGSAEIDLSVTPVACGGEYAIMAGDTRYFQAWYRDAGTTPSNNFTSAICLTFQ